MFTSQIVRYLAAGFGAACANFGSRFLFSNYLSYGIAVVLAYLVGMAVAFLLMSRHVFHSTQGSVTSQVVKFAAVNLLAVLQTLAVSVGLAQWFLPSIGVQDHAEALGHLAGVLVPVVTSYFGHKFFTFR
jgi:putative flippase GtrA